MLFNLDKVGDFCYSFSWIVDVLDAILSVSLNVLECDFGLLGGLLMTPANVANCRWRNY
jgi:hypothetical protein